MTPTRITTTPPTNNTISILTTSSLSWKKKKTNTTSRLRSVILRPTQDTRTKERSPPRCKRDGSPVRSTRLPFSDLRHRLINAAAAFRRPSGGCRQFSRTKRTERPAERGRQHSRSRPHFTQRSWTKSTSTPVPPKSPSKRSRTWARKNNSRFRSRSATGPSGSRPSLHGQRKTWTREPSQTLDWTGPSRHDL